MSIAAALPLLEEAGVGAEAASAAGDTSRVGNFLSGAHGGMTPTHALTHLAGSVGQPAPLSDVAGISSATVKPG